MTRPQKAKLLLILHSVCSDFLLVLICEKHPYKELSEDESELFTAMAGMKSSPFPIFFLQFSFTSLLMLLSLQDQRRSHNFPALLLLPVPPKSFILGGLHICPSYDLPVTCIAVPPLFGFACR